MLLCTCLYVFAQSCVLIGLCVRSRFIRCAHLLQWSAYVHVRMSSIVCSRASMSKLMHICLCTDMHRTSVFVAVSINYLKLISISICTHVSACIQTWILVQGLRDQIRKCVNAHVRANMCILVWLADMCEEWASVRTAARKCTWTIA